MIFQRVIIFIILIYNKILCFRHNYNNKIFGFPRITKTRIKTKIEKNNLLSNKLTMIGVSYRNNSLNNIEKICLKNNELNKLYKRIIDNKISIEIVALSTCNRFELYSYSLNNIKSLIELEKILLEYNSNLKLYKYSDDDVLKHLFKVSSGLDSLIFGEKQIEYQIGRIIPLLSNRNFNYLKNIFLNSLKCSEQIRKIENFTKGDISLVSVCVDLFINKINNSSKILVVGSGDTSNELINYFRNRQIFNIDLTNRNITNALILKSKFNKLNITIIDYALLTKKLNNYDYIFMSTSSPLPLIKFNDIKHNNFSKNLTIVDLCVPKNVESNCSKIKNIYLFNIEDLKKIQIKNIENNQIILNKSYNIIDSYISKINN